MSERSEANAWTFPGDTSVPADTPVVPEPPIRTPRHIDQMPDAEIDVLQNLIKKRRDDSAPGKNCVQKDFELFGALFEALTRV